MPLRNQNVAEYTRGTGVAELALAIETGKKNRANVGMTIHILEVIQGMMESANTDGCCRMQTTCEQPPMWDWMEAN